MILSMTGYGRAEQVLNGRSILVELRSVNSRYFEYSSRVPRSCSFLEDKLKKLMSKSISRGKVELSLQIQTIDAADTVVEVDYPLAKSYRTALQGLSDVLRVQNDITADKLARLPDVLVLRRASANEDQLWADVSAVAQQALQQFLAMRATEGEKLQQDVLSRLCTIEEMVGKVEKASEGRVEAYTQRLYEKLKTLLEDRNIDDSRIITEAAIFADKTAIDEETVRIHSHIQQYREILALSEPVGRKLDFLTQELNRETNTIGSKCQQLDITRLVVEMKSEIEKIREQIQNIE